MSHALFEQEILSDIIHQEDFNEDVQIKTRENEKNIVESNKFINNHYQRNSSISNDLEEHEGGSEGSTCDINDSPRQNMAVDGAITSRYYRTSSSNGTSFSDDNDDSDKTQSDSDPSQPALFTENFYKNIQSVGPEYESIITCFKIFISVFEKYFKDLAQKLNDQQNKILKYERYPGFHFMMDLLEEMSHMNLDERLLVKTCMSKIVFMSVEDKKKIATIINKFCEEIKTENKNL